MIFLIFLLFLFNLQSNFFIDFVYARKRIMSLLFLLSFLEVYTSIFKFLELSFNSRLISNNHFCHLVVCFCIFVIIISANIFVEYALGKLVYHELILGFLPFVELRVLIFAFQMHDKRSRINFVQSHMS